MRVPGLEDPCCQWEMIQHRAILEIDSQMGVAELRYDEPESARSRSQDSILARCSQLQSSLDLSCPRPLEEVYTSLQFLTPLRRFNRYFG